MSLKLRSVILAAVLLISSFIGVQSTLAASYGQCDGGFGAENWHTGVQVTYSTTNVDGLRAYIDPGNWHLCTGFGDGGHAIGSYISLEQNTKANSILQVGVVICGTGNLGCPYGDQYRYFWARGGCNGYSAGIIDLGPADLNKHQYSIAESANGLGFDLGIDGQEQAYISKANDAIDCWAYGSGLDPTYSSERWDDRDGLGSVGPGTATWYSGASVKTSGTWSDLIFSAPCNFAEANSSCATFGTRSIEMWTSGL